MKMNPMVMPIQMWKASIDFWQDVASTQLQMSRCALSIMGLCPSEQLKDLGKAKIEKTAGVAKKPAMKTAPAARLVEPQEKSEQPVPAPEAAKAEPAKVEAVKVEQAKPEAVPAEPAKVESVKVEPTEAQTPKAEAKAPVSAKSEKAKGDSVKFERPEAVAAATAPATAKVAEKPAVAVKPAPKKAAAAAAKPQAAPRRKAATDQGKAAEPMPQSTTRH